jgi:hypothetical protein
MNPNMARSSSDELRDLTRRHFFRNCGIGVGAIALSQLLARESSANSAARSTSDPLKPKPTHFAPRAKRVIFLFMAGGPSQLDMFEHKPMLSRLNGQPIPASFIEGKRFAFMDSSHRINLLGTRREFSQHGDNGSWVSDLLPHTATIIDQLTMIRTCKTDLFNHAPAKLFMNTGTGIFGRPSLGSWLTYGLGSECDDLPGFVVLQSGPRGPRGGAVLWGSGLLPTTYQGVPLRNQGEPILNLTTPPGVTHDQQLEVLRTVQQLNAKRLTETGDEEIATRINAYEMAYRMQTSAPDLMATDEESQETLDLYGIKNPRESSYARNCLLARRLVERGVRFVQLYHTNWDHHGGPTENLEKHLPEICREIDQPTTALILDLKRHGLLDDTLVIWGGEFGRTPMGEVRESTGRNHHIDAFNMWFAGGGFKPGLIYGETDEFGFGPIDQGVHVRDIHATILHQLGLSHERLKIRAQGLDVKLTGVVPARVVHEVLS